VGFGAWHYDVILLHKSHSFGSLPHLEVYIRNIPTLLHI
jgi:hypothetical protein